MYGSDLAALFGAGAEQQPDMRAFAQILQALGQQNSMGGQDTILAHINPQEYRMLLEAGGSGRPDPVTGLPHFDDGGEGGEGGAGGESDGGDGDGDNSGGMAGVGSANAATGTANAGNTTGANADYGGGWGMGDPGVGSMSANAAIGLNAPTTEARDGVYGSMGPQTAGSLAAFLTDPKQALTVTLANKFDGRNFASTVLGAINPALGLVATHGPAVAATLGGWLTSGLEAMTGEQASNDAPAGGADQGSPSGGGDSSLFDTLNRTLRLRTPAAPLPPSPPGRPMIDELKQLFGAGSVSGGKFP
ncbi:hypothetical protein [Azospirillum sp.]|uniref:hypothetical protein n=1 Tax=Azospirillum sp. TaxID=34012 RepID=UPI003D729732